MSPNRCPILARLSFNISFFTTSELNPHL